MRMIATVASLCVASTANAQKVEGLLDKVTTAADGTDRWAVEFELGLAPALGTAIDDDAGDDLLDQSEISSAIKISRNFNSGISISATPAFSLSPNLYDADSHESTLALRLRIQEENPFLREWRRGRIRLDRPVAQLFGGYTLGMGYTEVLDQRKSTDHVFAFGARLSNTAYLRRRAKQVGATGLIEPSQNSLALSVTPSLDFVASPDPDRRRFAPKLGGTAQFHMGNVTPFVEASIDRRYFSALRTDGGDQRRDTRFEAGFGLNFDKAIASGGWPSILRFSIAAKYFRNWSNAADAGYERIFFVPTIKIQQKIE